MWTLAVYVLALLVTFAITPKAGSSNAGPAALGDFTVPTASPGEPISVVFGSVLIQNPNVVWYGDMDYIPVYA